MALTARPSCIRLILGDDIQNHLCDLFFPSLTLPPPPLPLSSFLPSFPPLVFLSSCPATGDQGRRRTSSRARPAPARGWSHQDVNHTGSFWRYAPGNCSTSPCAPSLLSWNSHNFPPREKYHHRCDSKRNLFAHCRKEERHLRRSRSIYPHVQREAPPFLCPTERGKI